MGDGYLWHMRFPTRTRTDRTANYRAFFIDGETIRTRIVGGLPITTPSTPELEDCAINSRCFAACQYCYTSATRHGRDFDDIAGKAERVWGELDEAQRPFQIAIGGAGESTLHPDWAEFVKTVRGLNIVPNYTTNGMHLSPEIIRATVEYCGGVAVSYHPHIPLVFHKAVRRLSELRSDGVKLNAHVIVGGPDSLIDLKDIHHALGSRLDYLVVLPYQAAGRAVAIETDRTWHELFDWIEGLDRSARRQFAFGALFYDWLKQTGRADSIGLDLYEPEKYSGYRLMDETYRVLRRSSYDLTPKQQNQIAA